MIANKWISAVIGLGPSAISQALASGLNFAIGIIAARLLGVTDFGLLTLILLLIHFLASIEGNLISIPMMTLAGSRKQRTPGYFAAAMTWAVIFAVISAVLTALLVAGLLTLRDASIDVGTLLAAALAALGQNSQTLLRRVLFASNRSNRAIKMDGLRLVLMAGFIGWVWYSETAVSLALMLAAIGASALAVALAFGFPVLKPRITPLLMRVLLQRHWPISRWFLLLLLVSAGQEQVAWFIIGIQLGDTAVGGLRAAQYLLGTTHFLLLAMENYLPRQAAATYRTEQLGGLRRYLFEQTVLIGGLSFILIAIIAVFANELTTLVFGAAYAPYAELTGIFALSYGILILRSIWVHYLRAVEQAKSIFIAFLFASLITVALIFPAIQNFGLAGAAWAILLGHCVNLAIIAATVYWHGRTAGGPQ